MGGIRKCVDTCVWQTHKACAFVIASLHIRIHPHTVQIGCHDKFQGMPTTQFNFVTPLDCLLGEWTVCKACQKVQAHLGKSMGLRGVWLETCGGTWACC